MTTATKDVREDVDGGEVEENRLIDAADKIRLRYKGIRVNLGGMPQSRKVSNSQKAKMAAQFATAAKMVSASTLLWDADEPLVKDVRSVTSAISRAWHDRTMTLPTTTPGLRKIRKDCVGRLHEELLRLQEDLALKCQTLEDGLSGIISRLRESKRELFNADDYVDFKPTRDIKVEWSFPVVTEDSELAELDDTVYQHELQRVRSEGARAVKQFENQLAEGLVTMLDGVIEKLEGTNEKGKRKTFRSNTVLKVFDEIELFNDQLSKLGIGGEALTKAMARINSVVKGHSRDTLPDALRKGSDGYRDHVAAKFTSIAKSLVNKAVPVERRKLLRRRLASSALGNS